MKSDITGYLTPKWNNLPENEKNKEQQGKKVNIHNKVFKVMQICQHTPFSLEKGRHILQDL